MDNIISTKDYRQDISSIAICDIDDFSIFSERIHIAGGLFGLTTIVICELLKKYNLTENTQENMDLITNVFEDFILKSLKDNQYFEIKYLASQRFNFSEITEERKPEFVDFIHDYRRFVNKSLKLLIDKKQFSKEFLDLIFSAVVKIYFKDKSSIPQVEVNPEIQDLEYLDKIKKEKEDYEEAVSRLDMIKKKIKFIMIKPTMLKKKRDNMAAFIQVYPSHAIKNSITETDELSTLEKIKSLPTLNKNEEEIKNLIANENQEQNNRNDPNADNKDQTSSNTPNKDDIGADKANANEDNNNAGSEAQEEVKNAEQGEIKKEADKPEEAKIEAKVYKLEFLNEAQVFRNSLMKYEPYIIHHNMHEYCLINLVVSFRKTIKKHLKIDCDINELIQFSKDKYNNYTKFVIDHIMNNEIYIKETIVPISAMPIEIKLEEPQPENAPQNENPLMNNNEIFSNDPQQLNEPQ